MVSRSERWKAEAYLLSDIGEDADDDNDPEAQLGRSKGQTSCAKPK